MFKYLISLFLCWGLLSCQPAAKLDSPIEVALNSENVNIRRVMDSVENYAVQIRFSQVHRKNDTISFTDYSFQVDSTRYFYPASTVKFPIALLALSKLNTLKNMDRNTPFYVEGDTVETTIKKEIEKIFAVSDNAANNRLFEFLGQDYINQELQKILDGPVRISHRLSAPNSDEITSKPLIVYLNDSTTTFLAESINTSAKPLIMKDIEKGLGYYEEDSLLQGAFDFSLKNYYPIETQHEFLKKVLFPDQYGAKDKLNLSNEQLNFVRNAMSTVPKKLGYDPVVYYDGYCKFFMYGDTKVNIPEHIKIYNKVGDAYGTLTDCAYIHDTKSDIEFLLTATILVNRNAIFNDNTYEYDEIGFPFLAELGRELYAYELARKN
jgi:hypothetical protein